MKRKEGSRSMSGMPVIPVSEFSRLGASHVFGGLQGCKTVTKNGAPLGVILSVDAFDELAERLEKAQNAVNDAEEERKGE